MRSDLMKKGIERSPHRSLLKAMGYTDDEIARPIIGVANSANEIVPGHIHLNEIAEAVKAGVRSAGGNPYGIFYHWGLRWFSDGSSGNEIFSLLPGIDCRFR